MKCLARFTTRGRGSERFEMDPKVLVEIVFETPYKTTLVDQQN
jgi:hypothetical protein